MTAAQVLEHRASPPRDEPPYLRTCTGCGQPWPCPIKRAHVLAEAQEITAARAGDARRVGVLALVELGTSVWSSTRTDARGEPLGGVVVEIEDVPDRETGEFVRWFTCLDPYGGGPVKVHRIAESDVRGDGWGVAATANSRITNLIKRLAKEVAETKGSYLDPFCAKRIAWMGVLARVTNLAA